MSNQNNAAKFAFFYLLSLVALVFVALSVGMIIFQIINKELVDLINEYSGNYNDGIMRFAISSIIIATPIYYITSRQIYKNLYEGHLDKESGVRKWLTYLILLVAIIVMIGWLIGTINSFLGGELTSKAILKSLTAIIIAGSVFAFYLYDIRREKVENHKDKIIKLSAWGSLVIIAIVFLVGIFNMDTPQEVRKQKMDDRIINNFREIDGELNNYYTNNQKLPENLTELKEASTYLTDETFTNPITGDEYEYKIVADKEYQLCTEFQSDSSDVDSEAMYYRPGMEQRWSHEAGYQCLNQKVIDYKQLPEDIKVAP